MGTGGARRLAPALAVAAALVGCYHPSPPGGSYRCSLADNACPSGQHCTCGLCVKADNQAACGFKLDALSPVTVAEHQLFPVTITALMGDGATVASGFQGDVALSSTWGDVTPAQVKLMNGAVTVQLRLNRETVAPQAAALKASFAGNGGTSGKIYVTAPVFVREADAVVEPPSPARPFGFATHLVAEATVTKDGDGYRMYFGGAGPSVPHFYGFGVATSSDGHSFTARSDVLLQAGDAPFDTASISSPATFTVGDGVHLAFNGKQAGTPLSFDGEVGMALSKDGLSPFALVSSDPILGRGDCAFCGGGLTFPTVLRDPYASQDGGADSWLMFFSARDSSGASAIGRASSSDGVHFTPEPAPVFSSNLTGEAILLSPRVMVDGTVFKMWYTFARASDLPTLGDYCDPRVKVEIGYATSADGFFWVRSLSNPVVRVGDSTGWDRDSRVLIVDSVLPKDGSDPQSGVALYYTALRHLLVPIPGVPVNACVPNGIGRATRD
jgi:hypothetical protein